jgi:hypothetical protein
VDPLGERDPERITLGSSGGRFESFTYDIRDEDNAQFFVTEDEWNGALRRFTPLNPDWSDPWSVLTGDGIEHYLLLHPGSGTYEWTADRQEARANAARNFPNTEGIDRVGNKLYFVSKEFKRLFILDLDDQTYTAESTKSGAFDGEPDQVQNILSDSRELLFFTEDGGVRPGIHARDRDGRFFSILESPTYSDDESTGLAFSPDARRIYFALQENGLIYEIMRIDGLPFSGNTLNIKYHAVGADRY